ncbi:MAG: hypothetical protein KF901_17400 [Myxococcales bacterium]|nr:hypothetical protein [Myxococcales bacterium]
MLAFVAALGCGGAELGERCGTDSDCASGLECVTWPCVGGECPRSCEQPCASEEECPAGRACSGGLCAIGE